MHSNAMQTSSLWDALAPVQDHRRAAGKRYPLAGLLLIAIAAMLAGRRDQLGIVRWGRRLNHDALKAIGIGRDRVPAPSVWCELFQELDVTALEQALGGWVRSETPPGHVAIDGKRLRGAPPRKPLVRIFRRRSVPGCKASLASDGPAPRPMRSPRPWECLKHAL